ncbi:MAG TPA: hypothetical protein VF898_12005, partial [Chloroflexota bacterium]
LSPLVLHPASCPATDISSLTSLSGTILKLSATKPNIELRMRIANGNIATLLMPVAMPVLTTKGRASLADLRPGDHVIVSGRPDPTAALVFGVSSLKDTDLAPFSKQTGVIINVGLEGTADYNAGKEGQSYTVRFGKRTMVVDIDPGAHITLPNGNQGTASNLKPGEQIQVTGVHNSRLDEITSTSTVHVLRIGRSSATLNQTKLSGSILKLSMVKSRIEMRIRLTSGDVATVTLTAQSPVYMPGGRASVADLRPDDRVSAAARPDPKHAFVYTGQWVKDTDLTPFKNQSGVIFGVSQETSGGVTISKESRDYTMLFGKVTRVVDVDRDTRITLKNGRKGSISDLQPGVHARVTGVRNKRLDEVTSTSSLHVQ